MAIRPIGVQDGIAPVLIQQNGQAVITEFADGGGSEGVHLQTPNAQSTFASAFVPGTAGKLIAVFDFTPDDTGTMRLNLNLSADASIADQPELVFFLVADLTAITGGTLIAPGITAAPTSTTPAAETGVEMWSVAANSFTVGETADGVFLVAAGIPAQCVVGTRYGIAVVMASQTITTSFGTVSVSASLDEV